MQGSRIRHLQIFQKITNGCSSSRSFPGEFERQVGSGFPVRLDRAGRGLVSPIRYFTRGDRLCEYASIRAERGEDCRRHSRCDSSLSAKS